MLMSLRSLLSLLILSLGAAIITYAVARRPRERSSWALACAGGGVLGIYLAEFFLYQADLSASAGYFWQKFTTMSAGVACIGTVALALTLRDAPILRWERWMAGVLVLRAVLDMAFILTLIPQPQAGCRVGPWGTPLLHCGLAEQFGSTLALLSIPPTLLLFYRTLRLASEARRRVFATYLLPAVLLIAAGSTIGLLWSMRADGPLFPTGIIVAPAAAFAAAGLLRLEETGQKTKALPGSLWLLLGWAGVMVIAFMVDASWLKGQAPLMSLLTLIGGLAAALAYMALRGSPAKFPRAEIAPDSEAAPEAAVSSGNGADNQRKTDKINTPALSANACASQTGLRICLFGALSVTREGAAMQNHRSVWRSDKSKSLLAYLILSHPAGLTATQLVDALWPIGDDGDGDAEKKALNAMRSYVSTLRRILEPDRPRDAPDMIVHEGDRYRFAPAADVWVDVWEFQRLTAAAERSAKAGDVPAAADAWERAIALHGELGLLPDEVRLPAETVEPEREQLRQQWLRGVRWLARHEAANGPVEAAATLWETVWRAAPLDAEAFSWLAAHYRQTGQTAQLAALQDARRRAEAELGGEEAP